MLRALTTFKDNLRRAREVGGVYDYLQGTLVTPVDLDDLLRAQIVYSMSAFDKLMHDVIRVGMVETYVGQRSPTPKYLGEAISLELHGTLSRAVVPPAEVLFNQDVVRRLAYLSFLDPEKVADGLSLCWAENQKWRCIAAKMGLSETDARRNLKLYTGRRNAIVHQADIDPVAGTRLQIARADADTITNFLEQCGDAIVGLVM